jgi:hypothetical protein
VPGAVLVGAGSETVFSEPLNSQRAPNVGILDVRAEKSFKLGSAGKVSAMVDVFNALNADTITNYRIATGAAYNQVIALLDPRTVRFGIRYTY